MNQAQAKFMQWVQKNNPRFYDYVVEQYRSDNDDDGETMGFDWGGMFSTAVQAYGSYQDNKLRKKELQVNLVRAQQGQDPVDFKNLPQQSGMVYANGAVGVPTNWNQIALYGVLGLAVVGVIVYSLKGGKKK